MNKEGQIVIIEDDSDDIMMLDEIFRKLRYNNEIVFFTDGNEALAYLTQSDVRPFLILSDINMPMLSGFELRDKIQNNEQLHVKCIPYLFYTTGANKKTVLEAYSKSVQGFFQKPNSFAELERTIKTIIEYWKECIAPGNYG